MIYIAIIIMVFPLHLILKHLKVYCRLGIHSWLYSEGIFGSEYRECVNCSKQQHNELGRWTTFDDPLND